MYGNQQHFVLRRQLLCFPDTSCSYEQIIHIRMLNNSHAKIRVYELKKNNLDQRRFINNA